MIAHFWWWAVLKARSRLEFEGIGGTIGPECLKGGGVMFLIAKLALVTCGVYMLTAILLEAGLLVPTHVLGGILYGISYPAWAVGFAALCLVSFSLAWRIVMVPLRAGFHR
jgi:hypothetical protein